MANDTVNEATKAVSQATRRVTEGAGEAFRTVGDVTRRSAEQGMEVNRKMFEVWRTGAETTLKATFDLQNAMLNAGMSFVDSTNGGGHQVLQQWVNVVHQTQEQTLDAWQSSMKSFDTLFGPVVAPPKPR